jgi:hypothetical protein
MDTQGSLPGVQRPGREADHSPPSSAEVKKSGVIPPLPIRLHDVMLNSLNTGTIIPFFTWYGDGGLMAQAKTERT